MGSEHRHPPDRFQELEIGSQLADLKLNFYQQSLLLTALLDLLIEKGLVRKEEIALMASNIDRELSTELGPPPGDDKQ
ncbi:hypothetical protein [Staphylospora marina]|uniref:hypothetical protein n=1 Tax=Staphylospora marina TaxID=2490858 RepID=UPI000F5C02F1|nr:hypothetical protein [Staphylospora marina]